jgi:hypothetical protein
MFMVHARFNTFILIHYALLCFLDSCASVLSGSHTSGIYNFHLNIARSVIFRQKQIARSTLYFVNHRVIK